MTFEVREARPEEYCEAGRVTAKAYREFLQSGQSEWAAYLARIADIGERASRTTILIAREDDHILVSLTLELESRVSGSNDDPPLRPGEAHVRMLGVDPAARARGRRIARARGRRARPRRGKDTSRSTRRRRWRRPEDVRVTWVRANGSCVRRRLPGRPARLPQGA